MRAILLLRVGTMTDTLSWHLVSGTAPVTDNRSIFNIEGLLNWYKSTSFDQRRRVGIRLIVGCLVALVAVNVIGAGEVMTEQEVAFSTYTEALEQAAIAGKGDSRQFPTVRLEIMSGKGETPRIFEIKNDRSEVILRLLVLMRESKLFHLSEQGVDASTMTIDSSDPLLTFGITSPERSFTGTYLRSQFRGNIKAETLLKLITLHAESIQKEETAHARS